MCVMDETLLYYTRRTLYHTNENNFYMWQQESINYKKENGAGQE